MNRIWSFYDATSGMLAPGTTSLPPGVDPASFAPAGSTPIEGAYDHLSQKVNLSTLEVEDYIPDAPADTDLITYAWDTDTRRWEGTATLQALKDGRDAAVQAEIALLDAQCVAPLRAIVQALVAAATPASGDTDALDALQDEIDAWAALSDDIIAATTTEELAAVPAAPPP